MIVIDTPVEDYLDRYGLLVKREDLSCDGPRFSKTRGVLAHVRSRPEKVIGVLDTAHSQGGWAVARACAELGKECHLWYPVYKGDSGFLRPQQREAGSLGAILHPLPAGRSAVLYHRAKKELKEVGWTGDGADVYMMPNALKLPETVDETAAEVERTFQNSAHYWWSLFDFDNVLVSASSGTIAAGVARGLGRVEWRGNLIVHLGYSRPPEAVATYVEKMSGSDFSGGVWGVLVDEGYAYKDVARDGETPPWPCNPWYDLKAFRWWMREGRTEYGTALLWNVG